MRDAAFGGEEDARQFRAQLFLRIVRIAEPVRLVQRRARKPTWVSAPVRELVERRPVVSRRIVEGLLGWQMNAVRGTAVESAVSLVVLDLRAGVFQNAFCRLHNLEWCTPLRLMR